jgi:vacuolar-type H+-ATPase subunit F/Vma7
VSHTVRAVSHSDLAAGFELAGLRSTEARTPDEVSQRLRELHADPGVGVILLEESLYSALPEELHREFGRRPLPMIVPFPGPRWAAEAESAEAYIVELLRQVVGYRVKLK